MCAPEDEGLPQLDLFPLRLRRGLDPVWWGVGGGLDGWVGVGGLGRHGARRHHGIGVGALLVVDVPTRWGRVEGRKRIG